MSRLLKSCFIHYLSRDDVYSQPLVPAGKRRKLRSLKISLLGACNGILAHAEQRYSLLGPHVNLAEKDRAAKLSGLVTEGELEGMLEGKECEAVFTVFLFVASFVSGYGGFEATGDLTRMDVQYNEIVRYTLENHKEKQWVHLERPGLWSEIHGFTLVVQSVSAPHYTLGCKF